VRVDLYSLHDGSIKYGEIDLKHRERNLPKETQESAKRLHGQTDPIDGGTRYPGGKETHRGQM
jgi:hypothetical protein